MLLLFLMVDVLSYNTKQWHMHTSNGAVKEESVELRRRSSVSESELRIPDFSCVCT